MSISLVKGQKIDLTKGNAGLKKVVFALGWDTNRYDGDAEFDLDVSAFFTDDSGKVTGEQDFVFYGQPQHPSGKIPANISKISFAATIYDAENRLQNFGMVDNSYIRAYDADTKEELFKYELNEDFSLETGVVAGELYRRNGEWKFNAVGSGFAGGLAAVCRNFGVNL